MGRVLITGGTGFIGSHLVAALVEQGIRPTLLTRKAPAAPWDGKVDWVHHELVPALELTNLLEKHTPDTLFHLAGTRGRAGATSAAVECVELNVSATVRVLDAARRVGVRRVILVGSAEEYGNQPGPLHETLPLLPETPYGITKGAATRLAQVMSATEGCSVSILRLFSVYGPGQPTSMFVAQAVECAVTGRPFKMTHGRQRRDLVFVSDVVSALLSAAEASDLAGEVVNIGSGRATALCDVARLIWELSGTQAPLDIGGRPAPEVELRDTWADIQKARERLRWAPHVDLRAGLLATLEWARREWKGGEQVCPVG